MTLDQGGDIVSASILTDATGAYAFEDEIAVGTYYLRAHKDVPEGYLRGVEVREVVIVGGENIMSDLPLVKANRI